MPRRVLRDWVTTYGASFVLHAAVVGALAWFTVGQVRERIEPPREVVEFEVVQAPAEPAPPEAVEPAIDPPAPAPPPIPVEPRPALVPESARVEKVDQAKPFQPEAIEGAGSRDAPANAEAVPAPTTTMVFDMDAEVGGGGGSGGAYETTTTGTLGVPAPGRGGGGTGGGLPGAADRAGALDVKVSRDWQVTVLPEPLNDRDFEPDYPPLAKREGREATVVVRLYVDTTGAVARAEVVDGPRGHGFREAALDYAHKLRFEPARAGERVVASRVDWTVSFYVRN